MKQYNDGSEISGWFESAVVAAFSPALSTWRFLGFFEGFLRKHAAMDPEHDENSKKHALCHVERAGLKPATTAHLLHLCRRRRVVVSRRHADDVPVLSRLCLRALFPPPTPLHHIFILSSR